MSDDVKARLQAVMDAYDPDTLGDDPHEFDSWKLLYDAKAALEASVQAPAVDREAAIEAIFASNALPEVVEPNFAFTDDEWRRYQGLPEQGVSHRHHLEFVVNRWIRAQQVREGS